MTIYRFPLDLGANTKRYPYMQFTAVKFRERRPVVDLAQSVVTSNEEPEQLIEDSFYLPLPSNVQNAHNMNWEMTDLRGVQALTDFFTADNIVDGGRDAIGNLAGILFNRGAQVFTRQTPNPRKQALFKGIEPRTFTFEFTFSPHSLKEAEQIQRIVREMTRYTLPSLESNTSDFFQFPHEFMIKFHNVAGFPELANCVCTSVNTNYNPSQLNLLQSGHAVQTQMSLQFLETELMRKQRIGVE